VSNQEDERVQTPKTLRDFSHALSKDLPRRLAQLRTLGKLTRSLPRGRPKR
jgi:hypothetical protein